MNSLQKKFAVLLLLVGSVFAIGCATPGGDSAVLNDLLTERNVIRALYNEPELTGDAISVSCVDGQITLSGFVENEVDRQLAERVTLAISGVTSVNNNLKF